MPSHLLSLTDVSLTFGGQPLLASADLMVAPRARIAVVGRNGSGKSTLLKIAAGQIEPDSGERYLDPKAAAIYLEQEPDLYDWRTLGDYIDAGLPPTVDAGVVGRLVAAFGIDMAAGAASASGGEARKAAIIRAFAAGPDLILLDEPTNHLDISAVTTLERLITSSTAAIVIISHDRRLLEAATTETLWVDRGQTRQIDKGFREFEAWRDAFLEKEAADAHKLDRKIAMEEDWVRYGVTARRKRNVRRMAELAALRKTKREARKVQGGVAFSVASAGSSSARVIRVRNLSKSYGDRCIVRDLSMDVMRGDRIAIVGPNGAGKTTLLRLLTGDLAGDAGEAVRAENLQMVTLDQNRASLDPNATLADAITDGRGDWISFGETKKHAAAYLKDFLFAPEQFRSPVSALSGGERGRLALAAALAKPSNLLILDEPTNDLDLETLDLLEETLAEYPGTLLLVSHDRSFIDRVATSVVTLAPEGPEGVWCEYVGGYSDVLDQTAKGASAGTPTEKDRAHQNTDKAPARANREAKLSYKEKYALETLPDRIAELETEISGLKAALADPALFEKDASAFNKKASDLGKAEAALTAAEEEWLALELKREELEGNRPN